MTDKNFLWQTNIICYKDRGTVTKTNCLGKTLTVCDRHIMSLTNIFFLWPTKIFCDGLQLSVAAKDYFWRKKKIVCDRHILSVTDTEWLCQTQEVCDRPIIFCDRYVLSGTDIFFFMTYKDFLGQQPLSVKDLGYLWQKKTDRHKLLVKDTDCLWQTQIVSDRYILSVTDKDILRQT